MILYISYLNFKSQAKNLFLSALSAFRPGNMRICRSTRRQNLIWLGSGSVCRLHEARHGLILSAPYKRRTPHTIWGQERLKSRPIESNLNGFFVATEAGAAGPADWEFSAVAGKSPGRPWKLQNAFNVPGAKRINCNPRRTPALFQSSSSCGVCGFE